MSESCYICGGQKERWWETYVERNKRGEIVRMVKVCSLCDQRIIDRIWKRITESCDGYAIPGRGAIFEMAKEQFFYVLDMLHEGDYNILYLL